MAKPVRVLVVDDSALVRQILSNGLAMDPGIEVVGSAADPYMARDKIVQLKPDVLTLDVEMPRMDGVEFLRKLMPQYPIPVVMVSSLTQKGKQITMEALEAGADRFCHQADNKCCAGAECHADGVAREGQKSPRQPMSPTGKANGSKNVRQLPTGLQKRWRNQQIKLLLSVHQPAALKRLKKWLPNFRQPCPEWSSFNTCRPDLQRCSPSVSINCARWRLKKRKTVTASVPVESWLPPGAMQMEVVRSGGIYQVRCAPGEKVSGHCPSVDVMMHSVAKHVGRNAVGVMLTGMGSDGAEGMLAMKNAGARNIAQDEASSVVFGMPKVAYEKGGAEKLFPLDRIASQVISLLTEK